MAEHKKTKYGVVVKTKKQGFLVNSDTPPRTYKENGLKGTIKELRRLLT